MAAVLHGKRDPGHDEPRENLLGNLLGPVEAAGGEHVAGDDIGREDAHQDDAGDEEHAPAEHGDGAIDPVRRDQEGAARRRLGEHHGFSGRHWGGVERVRHVTLPRRRAAA